VRTAWGMAAMASVVVVAACGGSSATVWKGVRSVRVTVTRPGLPPPFGAPHTTVFTAPRDVARVTAALNAHRLSRVSSSSSSSGCAGGAQIAITILQAQSAPVHLSGYRCANETSGNIGGDLPGFLSAMGISLQG
jgi:hypothetical protein